MFAASYDKEAEKFRSLTGQNPLSNAKLGAMLCASIQAMKNEAAIISSEAIPKWSPKNLRAFKLFLEQHFDEIDVIGYIRPPIEYITSKFQQGIRTGRRKNFTISYDFKKQLENLDLIFGRDNVQIVRFSRSELMGGGVVRDFADRIRSAITPEEVRNENIGMSLEASAVLYARNVHGNPDATRKCCVLLANTLSGIGTSKLQFSSGFINPILDEKRADIKWVEARIGKTLMDYPPENDDAISNEKDLFKLAINQEKKVISCLYENLEQSNNRSIYNYKIDEALRYSNSTRRIVAVVDILGKILEEKNTRNPKRNNINQIRPGKKTYKSTCNAARVTSQLGTKKIKTRVRKILLFVGLPKVATSSVQFFFRQYSKELLAQNIWYPPYPSANHIKHNFIMPELHEGNKFEILRKILNESPAETVIISHEGLSNQIDCLSPKSFRSFRKITKGIDKQIILMIRNKDNWINSFYKQCVLNHKANKFPINGTSLTISQFSELEHVKLLLDTEKLGSLLKREYGAKSMLVGSLDDPIWFESLLKNIGLEALAGFKLTHKNGSVPQWIIHFVREINLRDFDKPTKWAWLACIEYFAQTNHMMMQQALKLHAHDAFEKIDLLFISEIRLHCSCPLVKEHMHYIDEFETFLRPRCSA